MTLQVQLGQDHRRPPVDHSIIDIDGHVVELLPMTYPFLRESLGPELFQRFIEQGRDAVWGGQQRASLADRLRTRVPQRGWWTRHTASTINRALPMFPAMFYEEMGALGIDFGILYPTNALTVCAVRDDELRQGLCRGFNEYFANVYGPFADRMTAAGIIPANDPDEAIAELEHCKALGLKVVGFPEGVMRDIPEPLADGGRWMYPGQQTWFDVYGLDSDYDYDPVWQRAHDLGFAVTFHGGLSPRPGICTSVSNFSYNHVGMFMQSMYPLCKALFIGGVSRRLPEVRFSFLESGVSWAVPLLADMIEHWERRTEPVLSQYDPERLQLDELTELARRYGGTLLDGDGPSLTDALSDMPIYGLAPTETAARDDWGKLDVSSPAEMCDVFSSSFYFGCEADDRTVSLAAGSRNGLGVNLKAFLGSDIGHWDVPNAYTVIDKAYDLVREGLLTEEDFRKFSYSNAVECFTAANPNFFDGTSITPEA